MPDALIGHTGFVGGNLLRQRPFDALYRSTDIGELAGKAFDTIVCAGAPAEKWKANQDPERDRANLAPLRDALAKARADRLILLSTVDVFGRPIGVDEDTPVETDGLHAYGLHRYELEQFARDHYDRVLVVRLPGLFGRGLKKNVIYDFLHDNQVEKIHSEAAFQFYGLDRLWADIATALDAGLDLIHLTTEPVTVRELIGHAFDREFRNEPPGVTAARYDFQTRHAALYGARGRYIQDRRGVLDDIRAFVASERQADG
ncbi:MAG: hypothetical protein U0800_13020 [Isosphaeraceae bacterium]